MRLLVTRPEPDCRKTAERIRALGAEAVEAPMLMLGSLLPERFDLAGVDGLAVTSARVAGFLEGHAQIPELVKLPVFCVGDRTAAAMKNAGFENVRSANGDVSALAELIAVEQPEGKLLYPCAKDRAGDLEGDLAKKGISCTPVIIYVMDPVTVLPPFVLKDLRDKSINGVLIYSKRTAQTFLEAMKAAGALGLLKDQKIFAISPQAAEPIAGYACVQTAEHPSEETLLTLALNPC